MRGSRGSGGLSDRLLRRLGVERGDEPAAAQPAEPHDARRQPILEARVQQSGLQVGGLVPDEVLAAPVRPEAAEIERAEQLERLEAQVHPRRIVVEDELVAQVGRSEEHTSELQSPCNLVCRLLLEKKN